MKAVVRQPAPSEKHVISYLLRIVRIPLAPVETLSVN